MQIQNGVYGSDSLGSDASPHWIEAVTRTHVFVRFASGAFLFEFREVIATRFTIVRPTWGLVLQSVFTALSTDRLQGRTLG